MIWTKSKINHAFVFEYDTRHTLEWRQLLEVCPILELVNGYQLTISDSLILPLSPGTFYVAQLFMDQRHVHILAGCAHGIDGHNRILSGPRAVPS